MDTRKKKLKHGGTEETEETESSGKIYRKGRKVRKGVKKL